MESIIKYSNIKKEIDLFDLETWTYFLPVHLQYKCYQENKTHYPAAAFKIIVIFLNF